MNLSCTNLPPGAECAFNPSSLTPNSSGSQATLTITTPHTLAQGGYSSVVSAAGGDITRTITLQVAVGGISSSMSPPSATIAAGSSANFAVALNSASGFAGQLTLGCSGVPSGMACSFNPPQVSVAANGTASSTLTVNVASQPSASMTPPRKGTGRRRSRDLPLVTAASRSSLRRLSYPLSFRAEWRDFVSCVPQDAAPRSRGIPLRITPIWHLLAPFAGVLVLAIALISCGGATTASNGSTAALPLPPPAPAAAQARAAEQAAREPPAEAPGQVVLRADRDQAAERRFRIKRRKRRLRQRRNWRQRLGHSSSSVTSQIIVQAQSGGATVTLGAISITVP